MTAPKQKWSYISRWFWTTLLQVTLFIKEFFECIGCCLPKFGLELVSGAHFHHIFSIHPSKLSLYGILSIEQVSVLDLYFSSY